IGDIEPNRPFPDAQGIYAQALATVEVGAAREIEFPVMPIAGQDAAGAQRSLAQRVALVWAAVVACEDAIGCREKRDLAALVAEQCPPLGLQRGEVYSPDPIRVLTT